MKAIAVKPGVPNTVHLTELPAPRVGDIPNGRGVLVRVLRVGVDGTDKEINAAEYGQPPQGYDFLIIAPARVEYLRLDRHKRHDD
jgi:threonine dehydrogenase-like Zn-dependent dehydrogenase